jgi:hypothetical protein
MIILKEIIKIASKISGVEESYIARESRIGSDLGIDGDDVEELIREVNSIYPLNFDGFSFQKYFSSESDINPIRSILYFLFSKGKVQASYEVTIGDIVDWVLKGKWEENQK